MGGIIVAAFIWLVVVKLEGEKPEIRLASDITAIGNRHQLSAFVSDGKSGLQKVWVGLLKDGKEVTLYKRNYVKDLEDGSGRIYRDSFNITIEPRKQGLSDGKALLRMAVWDRSWRGWLKGNPTYLEKEVLIDTKPPAIEIMSRAHYFSQGGSGLVIYRVSENCPETGVYVGKEFFPGYAGYYANDGVYLAFIGLDHRQGPGTEIYVRASDSAGNQAKAGVSCHIRKKSFRQDAIGISERFLNWKMPEFESDIRDLSQLSRLKQFIKVNRELREKSYAKIVSHVRQSEHRLIWEGPFLRLPKSARKAGFADRREYLYKGKIVDRQIHQGIDLASLEQSPVPASNSGRTIMAERAGIYGNTVILDHGFGLFSMYAHLSRMDTEPGQEVERGTIVGRTGTSGLAGGDHLHFGMMVQGTFVNPVEWWDASWIQNNIISKLNAVRAKLDGE